ncbi:carbon catabolite repressor protein 4 homolog 5 isoform X2 [Spinacia oleracea]|uniref:Carbon catabolite repressor protein 4 homolog 5 isoform X2 n=1 Tax=Spinacia oleracea TaxID=3562 RepID=A0ABM3QSP8_SPIOL|nr:carbon catabolite repressor protein 4 homolog 5 isoform X2 [Spinacia oleracea]
MNLSSVQHKLKKWLSFNFAANTNWAATLFHSPKLKYFNRPSTQPPVTMADQHSMNLKPSNRFLGKRTIFYDDEEEQTLTLNRCTVGSNSSSSNQFTSSQSYSYKRHTKWKSRKLESSNTQDFRNWSYSADCDPYDIRDKIILVSYNILAVENASKHPHLYLKVPFKYVKWEHRRAAIRKELAQYGPSILCFQAIDCYSDLHDALQQDGFEGVLKARTGDARDGCAIFWNYKRFKLLHEESIEFQSFGLRDNVAQFCVLKMNDDRLNPDSKMSKPRCLVVGNIHVLFNPNRGDIKLGQIRLFLEKAHRLSEEWGGIPVVLGGDFNSVPQSAMYQYISSAKLDVLQQDRKRISGQIEKPLCHSFLTKGTFRQKRLTYTWTDEELKLATGSEEVTCLQHSLNLRSAYLGVPGTVTTRDNLGEPLVTSFHSKFMGTVDYIWHSDQLVPVRVLETLPRNALEKMGGLPSKIWGSDHLALVCEFAFAKNEA